LTQRLHEQSGIYLPCSVQVCCSVFINRFCHKQAACQYQQLWSQWLLNARDPYVLFLPLSPTVKGVTEFQITNISQGNRVFHRTYNSTQWHLKGRKMGKWGLGQEKFVKWSYNSREGIWKYVLSSKNMLPQCFLPNWGLHLKGS
jgi:hypothetical protein